MINQDRVWDRLFELSQFGKTEEGGVTRLSFTDEDRKAKDLIALYMKEAGLAVTEDAVGNVIGRKEGRIEGVPAVVIGSHIDSVPQGGMFDGTLGVIAGIEVLQTMYEQEIVTDHPIEVIAFTDEEGSRFRFGMIGSRAFAGTLNKEHLQNSDRNGISIAQAMEEAGLDPNSIMDAARDLRTIKGYVELHIEQGKVLENHHLSVGVVSGIAGPLWTKWVLTGEAGHAGATPMGLRKDPLIPTADIIQNIETETRKYPNAVATIGQLSVKPGGVNVIPSQVEFTLDLRDIDEEIRNKIEDNIVSYARQICQDRKIEIDISTLQRVAPVPCSKEIREVIENSCKEMGLEIMTLPSGAGHDGMQFKDFCPIGMIFIQSKNGISHNPDEWSSKEDCGKGTAVLYKTVLKLARYL